MALLLRLRDESSPVKRLLHSCASATWCTCTASFISPVIASFSVSSVGALQGNLQRR